uniref:Uncharacterized protein n=1 Tax=Neolamprologus brichardi TaxID=32507 RepID=A0A3Q4H2J9_NEOBR
MKLHSFPASFCINVEGLEVSKQRLLSAHLPFLPLSTYNIILSISHGSAGDDHFLVRRVGVELEDSSVGVPILQFHAYTL